ncbi:nitroreductase/quinone reductase family protein [Streptosporangium saharense]|uniref:nitroreductase/quinone reductase family protein n=1 Tax=Streptosporangium saharense TaxID=1706840 RepID=UPI003329B5BD
MIEKILHMPLQPYREAAYALRVIQTRGRHTGQLRRTPIAVVQLSGAHYLVAPNRQRQWVKNLLASGECYVHGEEKAPSRTFLVEGEEAARVIRTYLSVLDLPFATEAFPFGAGDSLETIVPHTVHTAVFRLEPAEGEGEAAFDPAVEV